MAAGAAAGSIVPGWGTAIGAGLGLVSGLAGYFGSQSRARSMRRETAEAVRRKYLADQEVLGRAKAAGAASGVEMGSGSLTAYLSTMENEMARQRAWMSRAGASNASNVSAAGTIGLFTDLGKSFMGVARDANYWQSPTGKTTFGAPGDAHEGYT